MMAYSYLGTECFLVFLLHGIVKSKLPIRISPRSIHSRPRKHTSLGRSRFCSASERFEPPIDCRTATRALLASDDDLRGQTTSRLVLQDSEILVNILVIRVCSPGRWTSPIHADFFYPRCTLCRTILWSPPDRHRRGVHLEIRPSMCYEEVPIGQMDVEYLVFSP